MAEQSTHDVVNQAQSVGDASPSDVTAAKISNSSSAVGTSEDPSQSFIHDNQRQDHSDLSRASTSAENLLSNDRGPKSASSNDMRIHEGNVLEPEHDGEALPNEGDEVYTNGDVEGHSDGEEETLPNTRGDASGGSDTDSSKHDILDNVDRGLDTNQRHVRSESFKKPASFKAVSVTKNFLAKAASGTTPAGKGIGDKSSSTSPGLSGSLSQPVPRPRLVAKTGSGLRDAAPRPTNIPAGTARGAGPDPNQVWNKNRPVQPPPPKQFTDEELKQQYGIHLATRLQADEAGKEAKWADIDDDEDDWAPETIEWNDGTKITLPNPDILAEEQAAAAAALLEKKAEAEKLKKLTSQQQSSVGPNATILKVGAPPSGQPKSGGLVFKGAAEKPTLVARPTPPTPVKSPWAPLPPIERVPPVPINPPQTQQPAPRFGQRDPHGFESMPPPPSPTKEIAADDFNRSWRDSHTGSRELYNSQSGRYEPVSEGRRASARTDQGYRQPSVLQRPPQQEHQSPAEPSAAFQTSRSTGQPDGGRRRTSSNVSGGSGTFGRRVSFSKGQEIPPTSQDSQVQQRRGSQIGTPLESVPSPRNISPSRREPQIAQSPSRGYPTAQPNHRQAWQQRASPVLNTTQPSSPYSVGASVSSPAQSHQTSNHETKASSTQPTENQNPVLMQHQLMRERAEQAIKRRKEQEEKEEAEKKERIRLKLEALGLPGPNEAKEKFQSSVAIDQELKKDAPSTTILPPSSTDPKPQEDIKERPKSKIERAKLLTKINSSTQRGSGQSVTEAPSSDTLPSFSKIEESTSLSVADSISPSTTIHAPIQHEPVSSTPGPDAISIPQGRREEQPWKQAASSQDNFASWSSGAVTTHSATGGNLWGPPNNDKALGNGTFSRGNTRAAPRQLAQQQQQQLPAAPGPIGPPVSSQRALDPQVSPQNIVVNHSQSHFENGQSSINQKHHDLQPSAPINQNEFVRASQPTVGWSTAAGPGPIAPPSGSPSKVHHQRAQGVSAWKSFPAQAARQDAAETQLAAELHAARLQEEARTGIKREFQQPTFKETWRQVAIDEGAGQRQVVNVLQTSTGGGQAVENKSPMNTGRQIQSSPVPAASSNNGAAINPPAGSRPSRFFPQNARSVSYTPGYAQSASPPPPDSLTHPAYDGDIRRPLVSLPISKPRPIVKLPPANIAPIAHQTSSPIPTRTEGIRAVSQPLLPPSSWQVRFDGLLGRKPSSPPKTSALAIDSSTKAPLEAPSIQVSATVSLPRNEDGDATPRHDAPFSDDHVEVVSKDTEEALVEEREMGSLPVVKLPLQAPPKAWRPVRAPHNPRSKSKFQKSVDAESILPYSFDERENSNQQGLQISLRLPFSQQTKVMYMRLLPGSSRHRTPPSSIRRKGLKARENHVQAPKGAARPNQSSSIRPLHHQNVNPNSSFSPNPWSRVVVGH